MAATTYKGSKETDKTALSGGGEREGGAQLESRLNQKRGIDMQWEPQGAATEEALADILFTVASALKTQVISSPVLGEQKRSNLKSRLSEIADELFGLQQEAMLGD